jgi:hypothetical protein
MAILDDRAGWQRAFDDGWLAHLKHTGELDWKRYRRPDNTTQINGAPLDLARSRIMLITSAGAYTPATQPAFDASNPLGDYSVRLIPAWAPLNEIAYAHEHYDHAAVDADAEVLLPLNHLDALTAEGVIGELADSVASFSGYQPDCGRVIDETVPPIVAEAKRLKIDGALLVPA